MANGSLLADGTDRSRKLTKVAEGFDAQSGRKGKGMLTSVIQRGGR